MGWDTTQVGGGNHSDSNASQGVKTFCCAIKFQKFSFGIVILHDSDTNIGPRTVTWPSLNPTSHMVSEQERPLLAKQNLCQKVKSLDMIARTPNWNDFTKQVVILSD